MYSPLNRQLKCHPSLSFSGGIKGIDLLQIVFLFYVILESYFAAGINNFDEVLSGAPHKGSNYHPPVTISEFIACVFCFSINIQRPPTRGAQGL